MKFQQFLSATVILSAMTLSTLASDMPDSNKMSNVLRLSVPVATDANSETFGVVLNKSLQKVTLNELAANSALYVGNAFQVDAKVAKVCQKKGCFFYCSTGR
jgi:hypothetical protein